MIVDAEILAVSKVIRDLSRKRIILRPSSLSILADILQRAAAEARGHRRALDEMVAEAIEEARQAEAERRPKQRRRHPRFTLIDGGRSPAA